MLNYYAYAFAVSVSVVILTYIYIKYVRKALQSTQPIIKEKSTAKKSVESVQRKVIPSVAIRQKNRTQARMNISDSESEDNKVGNEDDILEHNEKKVGVKKARKLEEKKLKKEAREQEERERAIKKQLDEENAEKEKKIKEEEAKAALIQAANIEAERLENERKEQEFYESLKANFEIEEEGVEDLEKKVQIEKKLDDDIINHLIQNKVVMIEELSGLFNLKTQVCVDKIRKFLKEGDLTGVVDDRGKFIHINMDEYMRVTKFIKQRGRIHIKELAENSNKLIRLS